MTPSACIVGFFGNRRNEFSYEKTDEIDVRLIDEFKSYPGILSYTSMELADDYWANLVVHAEPDDREVWRTSVPHRHAVEMSPKLYTSVRIYNGHLPGGAAGSRAIEIDSTKYWDYDVDPMWKAIRVFDPPLTRCAVRNPSGTDRSGSRPSARSGSGWRAPRRAWPAAAGCGRRPCGRRRSTRSPTPG